MGLLSDRHGNDGFYRLARPRDDFVIPPNVKRSEART